MNAVATMPRVDDARAETDVRGIRVTDWVPGEGPRPISLAEAADVEGVLCIALQPGLDPDSTFAHLRECCPGITRAMVADLLERDELPEITQHDHGRIHKVSAFSAKAVSADHSGRAGRLNFELVEFLVNDAWVVLAPHRIQSFAGADMHEDGESSDASALLANATRRWCRENYTTPGDLAMVMLHELSCSFSSASRRLSLWLDQWELRFYRERYEDRESLIALRGLAVEFRSRLNAIDVRRDQAHTQWFPGVTDSDLAEATDRRIDRTLGSLERFAERIRSSMELLQLELAQQQADKTEHLQQRIERITSMFLVPTLIVGFFGANTGLPGGNGDHAWMSFEIMITLMILGSMLAFFGLPKLRERAARKLKKAGT